MEAEKPQRLSKGRWQRPGLGGGVGGGEMGVGWGVMTLLTGEVWVVLEQRNLWCLPHFQHQGIPAPLRWGALLFLGFNGLCDSAHVLATCPLSPSGSDLVIPSTSPWTEPWHYIPTAWGSGREHSLWSQKPGHNAGCFAWPVGPSCLAFLTLSFFSRKMEWGYSYPHCSVAGRIGWAIAGKVGAACGTWAGYECLLV